MAGRIAIYQGAQANLVGNAGSSEALGDDADDDAKHGGAAIEKLSPFELFHVDLGFAAVEILFVGGSVGHGVKKWLEISGGSGTESLAQQSAGSRSQVAGAGQHIGHHSGQDQNEGNDAGDGSGVIGVHGSQTAKVSKCY